MHVCLSWCVVRVCVKPNLDTARNRISSPIIFSRPTIIPVCMNEYTNIKGAWFGENYIIAKKIY